MYWVSVILTTYNRLDLLQRAISSVINQTLKNWELIIMDDESVDGTKKFLFDLSTRWKDIKEVKDCGLIIHRLPHCGWPGVLRAKGIETSLGEAICYLDDDNVFKPRHIQALWEHLLRYPKVDVVYGSTEIHNKDGSTYIRDVEFNARQFYQRNFIDTSDVMHRRTCITPTINWHRGTSRAKTVHEDIELWDQFIRAGYRIEHVPEILTEYYFHDRQRTDASNRFRIMKSECPMIS